MESRAPSLATPVGHISACICILLLSRPWNPIWSPTAIMLRGTLLGEYTRV